MHDFTGTHHDEDFVTTDVTHSTQQVIETVTGRWSIEVTFQEVRAHLGVETTRGWIERRVGSNTVLRAEPGLFGMLVQKLTPTHTRQRLRTLTLAT